MEENEGETSRQRKLLHFRRPETHKADSLALQLFICEEEVPPEQQERSPSLGQEEPEPLQIKEEQEDLFQHLEEADASKMVLHPVKCENDGKKTLSSQLSQIQDPELLQIKDELLKGMEDANHSKITVLPIKCENGQENSGPFPHLQIKIEENRETKPQASISTERMETQPSGEGCGVSEPASNLLISNPACNLEPIRDGQLLSSGCSGTETDDSDRWEEGGGSRSGLKTLQSKNTQKRLCSSNASTSTELMETQPDEEDYRVSQPIPVSQPTSNLNTAGDLESTRDGQFFSSDGSGTETDDSDECEETDDSNEWGETDDSNEWVRTGEPQSGSNALKSRKTQKNGQGLSNNNKFKSSVGSSHEMKLSQQIISETWTCKVCGKCFPIRHSLAVHVRVHPSDCGLCGKHLEPTESLKLHLQTHRTCTVCGKRFPTGTEWERHMRSHTGEKPYGCTLCHKRFVRKGHLKVHVRSHTGEKPYSCTLCHERFSQKGHMTLHFRSHSGEKPYSCTLCHKRYVKKSKLTMHLRSHTGEKPYSCTLCHERFGRKENLSRHLRSHGGGKQFSCTLCHKRFSRKENLKRHLRSHAGGKQFSCTVCGKGFNRNEHVERHMKIHTGEIPDSCPSLPPDSPQLSVCEEEVPPDQQERSPSLGQEEPEPLQIKEEQEELWSSQEGEQLQGLEEGDIIKLTSTPVSVKSEHDEEKPQSS